MPVKPKRATQPKAALKKRLPIKAKKKTVRAASVSPIDAESSTFPKKRGQQTAYNSALADEILDRIADGESVNKICLDDHMPHERTVRRWHIDDVAGFSDRFEKARDLRLEKRAEEIVDIADEPAADQAAVQRNKLRVDARKWELAKLKPERYGDRVDLNVMNKNEKISDEQLDEQLRALMEAKKQGSSAMEAILDDRPRTPRMITHQRTERLPLAEPKPAERHDDDDDDEDFPKRSVRLVRRN